MGRFSHENAIMMGDGRTAYMSDDDSPKYTDKKYNSNSGGVFFKFVADRPRDLSSGTLYAAKATQDSGSDPNTTGFSIEWIELAHGDNGTIGRWVGEYEGITPDKYVEGQSNYVSDADVWNWAEGKAGKDLNGDGVVGSYPDDRPAFLESRKAAAALGATYEWNKMEGVTADGKYVYLAMSEISESMDVSWGHAAWNTGERDKSQPGHIAPRPGKVRRRLSGRDRGRLQHLPPRARGHGPHRQGRLRSGPDRQPGQHRGVLRRAADRRGRGTEEAPRRHALAGEELNRKRGRHAPPSPFSSPFRR